VTGGTPGRSGPVFIRGDADSSREVDLSDAIYILNYLFLGGDRPKCVDAADVDDNAELEITDSVVLILHLFLGGDAPPTPYPTVGTDPTNDPLGCQG
jgi:hypothetical protein